MRFLIGPVSSLSLFGTFLLLLVALVQAQQFSQDIRGTNSFRFPGSSGPRTQLIQPQPQRQQQFRPVASQFQPPAQQQQFGSQQFQPPTQLQKFTPPPSPPFQSSAPLQQFTSGGGSQRFKPPAQLQKFGPPSSQQLQSTFTSQPFQQSQSQFSSQPQTQFRPQGQLSSQQSRPQSASPQNNFPPDSPAIFLPTPPEVEPTEIFPGITGKAPRDQVTQNIAKDAAQIALVTQNGGEDPNGKLLHEIAVKQPVATRPQANFVSKKPRVPAIKQDFFFYFPESRKIRYTKELQEQRDIADQQEELLLKDSSARFLNRRPNSPEFAATIIAGSSKDPSSPNFLPRPNNVPSGIPASPNNYNPTLGFDPVVSNQPSPTPGFHEDFRSLPPSSFQSAQLLSGSFQSSAPTVPAPFPPAEPFATVEPFASAPPPNYPTRPYAAAPAPVASSYQVDPYSQYQSNPYQSAETYGVPEASPFGFGYDVYHG